MTNIDFMSRRKDVVTCAPPPPPAHLEAHEPRLGSIYGILTLYDYEVLPKYNFFSKYKKLSKYQIFPKYKRKVSKTWGICTRRAGKLYKAR